MMTVRGLLFPNMVARNLLAQKHTTEELLSVSLPEQDSSRRLKKIHKMKTKPRCVYDRHRKCEFCLFLDQIIRGQWACKDETYPLVFVRVWRAWLLRWQIHHRWRCRLQQRRKEFEGPTPSVGHSDWAGRMWRLLRTNLVCTSQSL